MTTVNFGTRAQATAVTIFAPCLASLYHRHVMKWGGYRSPVAKKKAIIVVAHALLVIIWNVLATGKRTATSARTTSPAAWTPTARPAA